MYLVDNLCAHVFPEFIFLIIFFKREIARISTSPCPTEIRTVEWKSAENTWLKLDVDACFHEGDESFIVDMVIRDEYDQYVKGKNMRIYGSPTIIMEAEARGVQETLVWIEDLSSIHHVVIESDSEVVAKAVQRDILLPSHQLLYATF